MFSVKMEQSPKPAHAPTCVIDNVHPFLGSPNYLIMRVVDEPLDVSADIFTDGHVSLCALVKWRATGTTRWLEAPLRPLENDRWRGRCSFPASGRWEYAFEAWADSWLTWKKHFKAKFDADDPEIDIEAREGARLLDAAAARARAAGAADAGAELAELAEMLREFPPGELIGVLLADDLQVLMDRYPDRSLSTTSPLFRASVERERARFSA